MASQERKDLRPGPLARHGVSTDVRAPARRTRRIAHFSAEFDLVVEPVERVMRVFVDVHLDVTARTADLLGESFAVLGRRPIVRPARLDEQRHVGVVGAAQ